MYKILPQIDDDDFTRKSPSQTHQEVPQFLKAAIFAGGDFQALEAALGNINGVYKTSTGYFGGSFSKPSYKQKFGLSTHQRSVIYYSTEEERKEAQKSKIRKQMRVNKRIVTKILSRENCEFYLAENQYQKYYLQKYYRLCANLGLRSTHQFAESNIACKLNGILGLSEELRIDQLAIYLEIQELTNHAKLDCEEIIEDLRALGKKQDTS